MFKNSYLLEINAFIFLNRFSKKLCKKTFLADISPHDWKELSRKGFDWIWLMGLWVRSPGARKRALEIPNLRKLYAKALPSWKDQDILGSPYAVYSYELDPFLGEKKSLKKIRQNLRQAGLRLMVDYVPNHLALDHPWTLEHPDCFIQATESDLQRDPGSFFAPSLIFPHKMGEEKGGGVIFAHGRDPYFPAWTDTVQINYFSPFARKAALETLLRIAENADGVRCDMAMLGLSRIFESAWKPFLQKTPRPEKEFWKEVIREVKKRYPEFIFMAEAYWDTEWELQQLGFDFTYDKKLYDRLKQGSVSSVRDHLKADLSYQQKSVRFIENHDEERAASVFGKEKSCAAAAVMATVPGLHFFHEGQLEGNKIHIPIQMMAEPEEKGDSDVRDFYEKLLKETSGEVFRQGIWELHETDPAEILAWSWSYKNKRKLMAINYSPDSLQARIHIPGEKDLEVNLKPWQVLFKDAKEAKKA